MPFITILIAGVVATTAMTIFSYVYAKLQSKQFREPELLNNLMERSSIIPLSPSNNHVLGWFVHYSIGFVFAAIFFLFWELTTFSPGWSSGSIMGFAAGLVGIVGWKFMFKINDNPPEIDFSQFYFQLVVAHIVFGITAALIFAHLP